MAIKKQYVGKKAVGIVRECLRVRMRNVAVTLALGFVTSAALAAPSVQHVEFSSRPGSKFEVRVEFNEPPPSDFKTYAIEKPARIAVDFPGTTSKLDQKRYTLPYGNATKAVVLESGDRTRLVVELVKLVPYTTRVDGNNLYLEVGQEGGDYIKPGGENLQVKTAIKPVAEVASQISDLQFQRTGAGEGKLTLKLTDPSVDVNVTSEGGDVKVEFLNTTVAERLMRRYDVTDFATPVNSVDVNTTDRGSTLLLKNTGDYDYLAYQTDDEYVISVKPLSKKEVEKRKNEFNYVGDRISLNFQDIEVRAVLQLIADFTELNLVASDTVSGRITLRLQNVPWDQALELVLKTKGLDKRQVGNVLMVAPAAEIAERERQQIEANKQSAELAPLVSEFVRIRYAKADDVSKLFSKAGAEEGGHLVSPRGSVVVDARTNSLIITDTAQKLSEIRDLVALVDIPVRQVMIEARIVIAQSDATKNLGIEWGGAYLDKNKNNSIAVSGDTANVAGLNNSAINGTAPTVDFPGALLVDLGVARNSGFAVGFTSGDLFLTAELSALQAEGQGEVVSQPKVITGDKQEAMIKSGVEIPYQQSSSSGETTVAFKDAVLKLLVTPNITPDDRILLNLDVNQDSVGELVPSGSGGFIPSIDTTQLTTKVLVGNGETVVLGGVFKTEDIESVNKVPYFGDIPYVGAFFRSETNSHKKTETLIFITPRILADQLLD
jgi:type IV pilus assembly protein PilQ